MPQIFYGTDGTVPSSWTTGTRPASPVAGQFGYNTTLGSLEIYDGSAWGSIGGGGGGAGNYQAIQTTGFTAVAGDAYACNTTSAAFTVTLPASPTAGDCITLFDYAGTWGTNNLTLARNGNNINGAASNVILSINRQGVSIIYADATQGWVCYSQGASIGPYSGSYLIVAGGGSGGGVGAGGTTTPAGGGGGGGGYLLNTNYSFLPGTAYTVTVGAGGAILAGGRGANGGDSAIVSVAIAIGGGAGGAWGSAGGGTSGGSGGGSSYNGAPGVGTAGQGSSGGQGSNPTPQAGGGGGGATSAGAAAATDGGNGGAGFTSTISGTSVTYSGGGGGGGNGVAGPGLGGGGAGGSGGGANGGAGSTGSTPLTGSSASANTGGGGGGVGGTSLASLGNGGNGGSGVVIISYAGAQRGAGGTVTSSGGNTIHTFTSSGTYTA
jgi:hypothetical protein